MNDLRTTQINVPPDMIDFGIGQPGFDLLPVRLMQRAAARRLDGADASFLNYGAGQGDGFFRRALARFLSDGYGEAVGADDLFVTAGASNALDLTCTLFTRPGDTVFAAEPTYFLALRIFADHGLRVVPIPTDEQGMNIQALEETLHAERPALLYVIPTFQNPAGMTLPLERRRRLAELAADYDFLIAADEVYHLLAYTAAPPAPMAHFADSGRVISIGSFSKILAPGLRLGWIQAEPPLIQRFVTSGLVDSGGGLNPFTSALVRVALEEGWQEEYLVDLRRTYAQRIDVMNAALREELGGLVDYTRPDGGFFFWLTLPPGTDSQRLRTKADAYRVGFQPGTRFSSRGALNDRLRLSFAFYGEDAIREGVARLSRLLSGQVLG